MDDSRLGLTISHTENTAAAAQVYDDVCHYLSISARSDCRSLITAQSPCPFASFRTRRHCFADGHAIALSCALLARFGASPGLVQRFLTESINIVGQAVSRSSSSIPPLQYVTSTEASPTKPAHPMGICTIDFSCNPLLSPGGASAVLAACLSMPGPFYVELDLHKCSALTSLSLRPWVPFLTAERKRREAGLPSGPLTGLRLDGCPLTFLDLETLRMVQDLRWISLRYTAITNLWRSAEVMSSLPKLVAALFRGTNNASGDMAQLEGAKSVSRTTLLTREYAHMLQLHSGRLAGDIGGNGSLDGYGSFEDLSATSDVEKRGRGPMEVAELVSTMSDRSPATLITGSEGVGERSLDAPDFIRMADIAHCLRRTRPTPVTRVPYFSEFMMCNGSACLKLLDDVRISESRLQAAMRLIDKRFESQRTTDCLEHHMSMLSLIRNRENGFSRSVRRTSDKARVVAERRQKKRRRTLDDTNSKTDILAAVAAAGFPALKRPGRLSPETSLTVALAAASSASEVRNAARGRAFEKVQNAAFSAQEHDDQAGPSREVVASQTDCKGESRRRQYNRRSGLQSFCESAFETAVSATLIKRRGTPRIQYLHQAQDRPRQFEYNPAKPSELVYGTEHGYLVVIDQETGEVKGSCLSGGGIGYRKTGHIIPQTSNLSSISWCRGGFEAHLSEAESAPVYGLSWLNKRSDVFLSGNNHGAIHVYNVNWMGTGRNGGCMYACETFDQLTSLHVSCDDRTFAASGWQHHVGLYDLETGRRLELMRRCHTDAINVIKFAHNSPHVLVTSSFDQYVKKWDLRESRPGGGRRPIFQARSRTDNVMVCFSPDDSRLLVSAVDNEVRQYLSCYGRLELEYDIPKSGSAHNFTRSYYMNDRDYIIVGSCMENVVRVYNARTGAFFSEVDMDNRETKGSRRLYVQSLRANPMRPFNFSTILASDPRTMHGLIANADLHRR